MNVNSNGKKESTQKIWHAHLWKDANPGIAEVEDGRERLAGLR